MVGVKREFLVRTVLVLIAVFLSILGAVFYPGCIATFFLFSFLAFWFLYFAIFQTFSYGVLYIGIFLWLGIWFKSLLFLVFKNMFMEPTGNFNYSGASWDQALVVASC